jgi:hypothetical protein
MEYSIPQLKITTLLNLALLISLTFPQMLYLERT